MKLEEALVRACQEGYSYVALEGDDDDVFTWTPTNELPQGNHAWPGGDSYAVYADMYFPGEFMIQDLRSGDACGSVKRGKVIWDD